MSSKQRTWRLVLNACSSNYSEWNYGKSWSSPEWKSDELMEVGTGRLVYEQPPGLFTEHTDNLLSTTMIWTLTPSQNQTCRYYPDHSVSSFTADSNLLQPTGEGEQNSSFRNPLLRNHLDHFNSHCTCGTCEQNTLTRHIFSCFTAHISMSHVTLAQDVCPHHVIHASCAVVVLILFDSPFCTLHRLSHLPFHSPDLHLHLHLHLPCGLVRGEVHCALPRMRS